MSERLITVNDRMKLWIYKVVSKDEVIGRTYRRRLDASTKSGYRWVRRKDTTLYRHEDDVWRDEPEDIEPEMKRWIAHFDIRDDYPK